MTYIVYHFYELVQAKTKKPEFHSSKTSLSSRCVLFFFFVHVNSVWAAAVVTATAVAAHFRDQNENENTKLLLVCVFVFGPNFIKEQTNNNLFTEAKVSSL